MLPIADKMDALGMVATGIERARARSTRSVCVVALYPALEKVLIQ